MMFVFNTDVMLLMVYIHVVCEVRGSMQLSLISDEMHHRIKPKKPLMQVLYKCNSDANF